MSFPHVLVFMYYDTNHGFEELARQINEDYCKEHGYTFIVRKSGYESIPPWWRKVFLLRDLMNFYPHVQYYMWMDSDAAFVQQRHIPVGKLFEEHDGILHIGKDPVPEQSGEFNAGVFAVKNTSLGRQLVYDWVNRFDPSTWCRKDIDSSCNHSLTFGVWSTSGKWTGPTFEQGVLNELAKLDRYKPYIIGYEQHYFSELDPMKVSFVRHLMGSTSDDRKKYFQLALSRLQCYAENSGFRLRWNQE